MTDNEKQLREEILNKALYSVKIKHGSVNINMKNIDRKAAWALCETVQLTAKGKFREEMDQAMGCFGFRGSDMVTIDCYFPRIKTGEVSICGGEKGEWLKVGDDKVCSMCGSMHPMQLIELIKQRGISVIGASTKSYKWYIERPEIINASLGAIKYYRDMHDTPEFLAELAKLLKNN